MTYRSKEEGTCYTTQGQREEAPGSARRQKKQGRSWPRAFPVVCLGRNGSTEGGQVRTSLGLLVCMLAGAGLCGLFPGCPIPGPGVS